MKYNYKEIRTISLYNIKNMCVDMAWYNKGTNADYNKFLSYSNKENITSNDIIEMAINVYEHTEKFINNSNFDTKIFSAICSTIADYCDVCFKEEKLNTNI